MNVLVLEIDAISDLALQVMQAILARNEEAQEIMEAHMTAQRDHLVGPTMEQPHYNMFHRERVELEYSHIYKKLGLGTTIWSPLASGTLTSK